MSIFSFSRRPNIQQLKNEKNVEGLIEALAYRKDHNVRLAAASALGQIGDHRAVIPLLDALKDQHRVREVAIISLGEIGDSRAVGDLIEGLDESDWEIRSTIAKALGKIGAPQAIKPLIKLLGDNNKVVRWHASQALEIITGESHGEDTSQWENENKYSE